MNEVQKSTIRTLIGILREAVEDGEMSMDEYLEKYDVSCKELYYPAKAGSQAAIIRATLNELEYLIK